MNMQQIQNEVIARCNHAKLDAHIQNARKWGRVQLMKKGYTDTESRYIIEQAMDVYYLNLYAE